MVAVRWLDDHRQADVLGGFPGLFGAVDHLAFGNGHAAGLEQALGEVLVAGDAFGNRAGALGLGCPDAALGSAVAELHQVAIVQANVGNAPVGRCSDDARGAGAEVLVVHLGAHARHGGLHVEGLVIDGGHDERVALGQRHTRHALVAGTEHHAVHPAHRGAAGLAKTGGHARQVQQFNDDVLQHMAAPGAFLQALQETAAFTHAAVVLDQGGQPGREPVVEARQCVGGVVFQHPEVQPDFQHGAVGPDIGAAQVVDAKQLDVVDFCHGSERFRDTGRAGQGCNCAPGWAVNGRDGGNQKRFATFSGLRNSQVGRVGVQAGDASVSVACMGMSACSEHWSSGHPNGTPMRSFKDRKQVPSVSGRWRPGFRSKFLHLHGQQFCTASCGKHKEYATSPFCGRLGCLFRPGRGRFAGQARV